MFRRSLFRFNAIGLSAFTGLLLATFAGSQVAAPGVGPKGIEDFCSRAGPVVYSPGFTRLPAVHSLPKSAHDGRGFQLPFAPPGLVIHAPALDPPIFAGTGPYVVGYRLAQREGGPSAVADWEFELHLSRVDSGGENAESVADRSVQVGRSTTASKPTIAVSLPRQDGFYRVDLTISDAEGSPLGDYTEYVQVVPEVIKARLAINSRRFRTGQSVAFRVENLGSIGLSEPSSYSVQRHVDGGWRPVKRFDSGPIPLDLGLLPPEAAGSCTKVSLPKNLQPGKYRIVDPVSSYGNRGGPVPLRPAVTFDVHD